MQSMWILVLSIILSINCYSQDTLFWDVDTVLPENQDIRRFDIYHANTIKISPDSDVVFTRIDTVGRIGKGKSGSEPLKNTYYWLFNTLPGNYTYHHLFVIAQDHLLNSSEPSNIVRLDAQYPSSPFNTRIVREVKTMAGDTLIIILPK